MGDLGPVKDFDVANQRAIDRLNQRGGRMLSLVDLVEAGTLPLEAAALLAWAAARGCSLLTAAGPGGVGKTTLLGACLAFLPGGTECVPVDSAAVLDRPRPAHPRCLLVHEINNADYYGYLWGPEIGRLFAMIGDGCSVAATLHAESLDGVLAKLAGAPLRARREDLARVDLVALMAVEKGLRRVTGLWLADGRGGHVDALAGGPQIHALLAARGGCGEAQVARELDGLRALLLDALSRDIRRMELLRALARRSPW